MGAVLIHAEFDEKWRQRALTGVLNAARSARRFVESVRSEGGMYRLVDWPDLRKRRGPSAVADAVVRLRRIQRLTMGFLDPVEDALYLTAGLRSLGIDASFCLGRERVPAVSPAGFFPWVSVAGEVVSTSLPVAEEYTQVYQAGRNR